MTTNQFTKFAVGDLVYRHPSTKQREGNAGIVVRVIVGQEGDEPHVVFQCADGSSSSILDCSKVGYGGKPPRTVNQALAIVKVLSDAGELVTADDEHQEWPVEQKTDGWALACDPWDRRLHWLPPRGEYRLRVGEDNRSLVVTMQSLLL